MLAGSGLAGGAGCAGGPTGRQTVRLIDGRPQVTRYVSPSAYQHYLAARLQLARGDGEGALRELRAALLFDEASPYLHTELARVLARLRRTAAARQALAQAFALERDYPDALLLLGDIAAKQGQRAAAEASYRRCHASNTDFEPCVLRLDHLLQEAGRVVEARALLTAQRDRKKSGRVLRRLALLCLRNLDLACAAEHYQRALQEGTSLRLLLRLATVLRGRGEFDASTRYLREVFDRSDGDLRTATELLEVLAQQGKTRELDDLLAVLSKQLLGQPEQVARLAELMVRLGRAPRALALVNAKGLSASPGLTIARGLALAKLGRLPAASAALASELAGKQGPWAALELAQLWRRAGKPERAVSVLEAARKRHPKNAGLVRALSNALYADKQHARAVTVVREALAAQPKDVQLRFALAAALQRGGKGREAVSLMAELAQQEPRNAAAHNFVGFTLAEQGVELARAERAVRRALYLEPGQAYVIDSLGWVLFRRNQLAEAHRVLEIATRLAPEEAEIAAHLGEVAAALKRLPEALKLYRRAIALGEHPWEVARWRQRLQQLRAGHLGARR